MSRPKVIEELKELVIEIGNLEILKKEQKKKELEKLEIKKTELARKIAIEEIETPRIPIEKSEDLEKNRTCKRKTRKIRYRNRKNRKWRISRKTRNSKRYDKR